MTVTNICRSGHGGKKTIRRYMLKWEDNIEKDLKEIVGLCDWTDVAQNRDNVRAVLSL